MATLEHFGGPPLREGLLLDADYVTVDGRALVRLWILEQGRTRALVDPRFDPYFYAVPDTEDTDLDALARRVLQAPGGVRPRRVEVVPRHDGLRALRALRVVAYHPQDVPRLRDAVAQVPGVREHREADIPFAFRYLIDHRLRPMGGIAFRARASEVAPGLDEVEHVEARERPGGEAELKLMAFDLEVYNPHVVPRPREDPVLLISVATSAGKVELLRNEGRDAASTRKGDKALLQEFLDLLRAEDPDVLLTYNGDEFDWPYLIERARLQGVRLDVGRDGSEPRVRQAGLNKVVGVVGRANVDLFRVAQRDLGEVKVKTLKNVADFLGVTEKEDRVIVAKDRIHAMWDDPRQRAELEQYARDDAVSTLQLGQRLLPLQAELARMTRMPLEEETKMGRGRQVDWFLLAEAHERGLLAPNKTYIRDEVYEGGTVLDPPRGLHEDVVALDFSSMYPSIMVGYNVSPETHLPPEIAGAFKAEEFHAAPEVGHRFLKEPRGFFPGILHDLVQRRREWKKVLKKERPGSAEHTMADVKQQTIKILTNCFSLDTEVMTPRGPVNIRDLRVGDPVYSIDPATLQIEVKPVLEAFGRPYEGDMVQIRTETIDFLVTPNHRLLVSTYDAPGRFRFVEAGDLRPSQRYYLPRGLAIEGRHEPTFRLPIPAAPPLQERAERLLAVVRARPGCTRAEACRDAGVPYASARRHLDDLQRRGLLLETATAARQGGSKGSSGLFAAEPDPREPGNEALDLLQAGPRHSRVPAVFPMDDWLRLMAWYVSEGSLHTARRARFPSGNVRGEARIVQIAQKTPAHRDLIRGLLTRMGLSFSEDANGFRVSNALLHDWFLEHCGKGSEHKRFPGWVFGLSVEQREVFLDTLMLGDGDRRHPRYTTKSDVLRDQVARLLVELGHKVRLRRDSGVHRITFHADRGAFRPRLAVRRVPNPAGTVHCVTVADHHTVLAGRNGTFQWVGQSFYGYTGWTGARWYKRECAEATTAWGRHMVKQVVDEAKKEGLVVLYGDTDSCFVRDHPGIPAFVERINGRLPVELEVQSRYEVIFFTGAKKRYAGLTREGKVVVRGLEVRRGDWCELAKALQEEVLDTVLRRRDPDAAIRAAREAVQRVRDGKGTLDELAIHKTLTMDPEEYKAKQAHVHAVERAQAENPEYRPPTGAKIGYVLLKATGRMKGKLPTERAVLLDFVRPTDELDLDYYVDKQLVPAALRVLEFFGATEDDLKGRPKQQSLQDWF